MNINWDDLLQYNQADLTAAEDSMLDAIRFGLGAIQTQGVAKLLLIS